ncbi:MAG TPA: hypothetical protein VNF68_03085 [Candidatus Baltobacteraceae bacterium]|nr:hypothetical protein [Candidatus Baltobacteraceae bacterium]
MNAQRIAIATCCFAAAALGGTTSALAARVYNDTVVRLEIIGTFGGFYLGAGHRSDSISWTGTDTITVTYDNRNRRDTEVCNMKLIADSPLTGARYLIIAQAGRTVHCILCSPEHQLIKQNKWNPLPADVREFYSPKQAC